jgi:hypothetical protein
MQWSSTSCQFLPVNAVVVGDVQAWTFGGFVTAVDGQDDGEGPYTWYIDYADMAGEGTGSFPFRHAVMLCPNWDDSSGPYEVVGEVGVRTTGATEWVWLPYRATFTVRGIPTETTLDEIGFFAGEATFQGRVRAVPAMPATFTGCRGGVAIEAESGSEWQYVTGAEVAADGTFAVRVPTYQLTGTRFRARSNESICASATSQVRELVLRLPTARVSSVSRESKLRVDIDPNLGRRSWTFHVERSMDEGWSKVGTYRTQGGREIRTINLRSGCYRVRVPAQKGYAEYISDSACLAR